MNRPEAGSWPLLQRPDDPWPWNWPEDDLGYADAVASPWLDPPDPTAYATAARQLQDHLDALNRTHSPIDLAELQAISERALVSLERRTDKRPAHDAPRLMSPEEVARMGLDGQPDAGLRGTDEVLGPWVECLEQPADRDILLRAVAHWCLAGARSPAQAWTRSRPAPSHAERAAARALIQAPLNLWSVQPDGVRWRLTDLIGIAANRHPTTAVHVDMGSARPLKSGDQILARVLPAQDSWHAWGALRLPTLLDRATIDRSLLAVLAAIRLRNRRATVDDVLRLAGHEVARRLYFSCYRLITQK